jgi:hypothetical protein
VVAVTSFTGIREQILNDNFPQWNALTWARTNLLRLVDRQPFEQVHGQARGVVTDILAVGFDSLSLRVISDVTQVASGDIYIEVRYTAAIRFCGRVQRKHETRARALHWRVSREIESPLWLTVSRVVELPVDVLVILNSSGRAKHSELRNFGFSRGRIGLP